MKIFRFRNPINHHFAEASRLGTWYPDPSPGVCPECGISRQKRIPPLIIEWLPGCDEVGDFTWPGGGEVVVSQRVREILEGDFQGFEFNPVEMWQNPKLSPPKQITKRTKSRVWLPYTGPTLYNLWITTHVSVDFGKSSVELINECKTCGYKQYKVNGVEVRKSRWNPAKKELNRIYAAREEKKGVMVRWEDLQGIDIFGLVELPKWIFCTERVKRLIEQMAFTNVSFLEMGDII